MTIHKIDQRYIWIILGAVAICLRIVIPAMWLETFYSRGLFVGVRYCFDYTTGLLPVPMLYVFVIGLLTWLGAKFYRRWKANRRVADDRRIIVKIGSFILNIVAFASAVIFFFLFLWGFNYGRIPVEDHIGIQPKPLDQTALLEELNRATADLVQAYGPIADLDSLAFAEFVFDGQLEPLMRNEVSKALAALGYPHPGRPRARMLRPTGVLLRISTAGFYMPLVAECNIDAGLHPLQIPHVMAHELAHGYGFGNEGTCNFWAYLSCRSANDPRIRYSGLLSYWRSVAAQYRWVNPEDYKRVRATLPRGIIKHMEEIRTQMNKFPDLFPVVRDATYNAYLKAQGIEEGLLSYSRVVLLVNAYRERIENNN